MARATEIELARTAGAAFEARALVMEFPCELAAMQRADAILATTELVTNAYLYGEGPILLRLEPIGRGLRISVADEGESVHRSARSGYRLGIIGVLSERWGVEGAGTVVWCEIGTDTLVRA